MRKILTPEEREARRKAANRRVFERYRTYEGEAGSPDQWTRAAEAVLHVEPFQEFDPHLEILDLKSVPRTIEDLKSARAKALLRCHEDKGGTKAETQAVIEAFNALKMRIR